METKSSAILTTGIRLPCCARLASCDNQRCPPANVPGECVGIDASVIAEIHAGHCHGRDPPLAASWLQLLHQAAEKTEAKRRRQIGSRQAPAGSRRLTAPKTTI